MRRPDWIKAAHYRLKQNYSRYLLVAALLAIVGHSLGFRFSPPYVPRPYQLRERKVQVVDVPDEIVIPPPPKEIAHPALPQEAEISEEASEEETIEPTGFNPFAPPVIPQAPKTAEVFVAYDSPPQIVHSANPEYPEIARQAEATGYVYVLVTIDENGRVINASVQQTNTIEVLQKAAIAAAYKWLFRPAMQRDVPVACQTIIPFQFELD